MRMKKPQWSARRKQALTVSLGNTEKKRKKKSQKRNYCALLDFRTCRLLTTFALPFDFFRQTTRVIPDRDALLEKSADIGKHVWIEIGRDSDWKCHSADGGRRGADAEVSRSRSGKSFKVEGKRMEVIEQRAVNQWGTRLAAVFRSPFLC